VTDPKPKAPSIPPEPDEVTAVWDEDSAREHGFEIKSKTVGPATAPSVGGDDRSSVVVSSGRTGRHAAQPGGPGPGPAEPAPTSGGLSWPVAIAIAIAVGVTVFFVVRLFR